MSRPPGAAGQGGAQRSGSERGCLCCLKVPVRSLLLEAGWPVASGSDLLLLVRDEGSKVLGSLEGE